VASEREFLLGIRLEAERSGADDALFDNLVRSMEERAAKWRHPFSRQEHAKLLHDKCDTLIIIEERRRNEGRFAPRKVRA
jgi:hypothetical protein